MARRPKKPDAPKKPKSKSGGGSGGGGTATATQAPPLDERFQKMREILEDGTGEDLSQYSNEDIVELYGGLADDLGVGKMTIDDAYNKMRADADLRTNINERMAQNEPADPPEAGAGTPEEQNERNLQQAIAGQERTDGVTKRHISTY